MVEIWKLSVHLFIIFHYTYQGTKKFSFPACPNFPQNFHLPFGQSTSPTAKSTSPGLSTPTSLYPDLSPSDPVTRNSMYSMKDLCQWCHCNWPEWTEWWGGGWIEYVSWRECGLFHWTDCTQFPCYICIYCIFVQITIWRVLLYLQFIC